MVNHALGTRDRPYRVAHIGAGSFSRRVHAPALQYLAREPNALIEMAAICDLDETRPERALQLRDDFGYKSAFANYRHMIAEVRPDIIVCTVTPSRTAQLLEYLLPLRIPLFTEKPPGVNSDQVRQLVTIAQKSGTLTCVGFNRRRMPDIEFAKRWITDHGPIRYIRADLTRHKRYEPDFCVLTGIHALDTLRYFAGEVTSIETNHSSYGRGTAVRARLEFCSGATADLSLFSNSGASRETYLLEAQNVTALTVTPSDNGVYSAGLVAYRDNQKIVDRKPDANPLIAGGFVSEHLNFLNSISKSVPVDCSLEDAQKSLLLAIAVQEGYTGRWG